MYITPHSNKNLIIKVNKNFLGQYGVWWGSEGLANRLAFKRFFKTEEVAKKWAEKFYKKILK